LRAEACPPARPTTALHMSRHITGLCRSSTLRLSSFVFVCSPHFVVRPLCAVRAELVGSRVTSHLACWGFVGCFSASSGQRASGLCPLPVRARNPFPPPLPGGAGPLQWLPGPPGVLHSAPPAASQCALTQPCQRPRPRGF
jgi:hypothetical protein